MKYIFEHYLPAIIVAAVSLSLIGILVFLLTTTGPVATSFQTFITNTITKSSTAAGL